MWYACQGEYGMKIKASDFKTNEIIKIMREYVDRTQFELADETNISRSALQTYEYGIVNYALETLVKIAKYYHFDII